MDFPYKTGFASVALDMEGYYVWDSAVIKANGKYHMFCSRWKQELGFGCNWVFNSEIVHCVSEKPEGPYIFSNVVLPRRGRQYFDGMNTHNTCIKYFGGKYYLYYMGTTYGGEIPDQNSVIGDRYLETWNRKRIGLAVAEDIDGEFTRFDAPLLEPRDCSKWDCTITTNPSVVIKPNGKTYMIYKSRSSCRSPLQLGVAAADSPDGKFERICNEPILNFADPDMHIEDPFVWFDSERNKFCLIAKDDLKNGSKGITGEWGAGFYAESDDCINFEIAPNPKVYSRNVRFANGEECTLGNLERPSLLTDENGKPTHIFCAAGKGRPYDFSERTCVVCMELIKK
ncbi:MAG: glycoside hydrolase family protein [Oscillospiraceae bacterium]|nr:glycoside hydrolase family protein [Oscillospiraceae bacterium]